MKLISKNLIAYASAFVSFIFPKISADEIVLFGSSARGEASSESDIDIFVNIKKDPAWIKEIVDKEILKFYKSKLAETWINKGIRNKISIKVGDLDKWKLKRSVISDGIVLYSRYKEVPKDTEGYSLFYLEPIKNIAKRNFILRKLFGRKEKGYEVKGVVEEFGGKKLSPLSFIVLLKHTQDIIKLLNSKKIDYSFFEFWSDGV